MPSVVDYEGSHSRKAIAFINSKGNIRLDAKSYSESRMSTQTKIVFLTKEEFIVETQSYTSVMSKIGERLWKK
jgi:hypothetical protein